MCVLGAAEPEPNPHGHDHDCQLCQHQVICGVSVDLAALRLAGAVCLWCSTWGNEGQGQGQEKRDLQDERKGANRG